MNLFTKADDASRRVEEFLVAANLDALDRAAFESADARRQGLAFTDGLTLTAAGAGNAAALQRQSGARKTADAARNAYKNMQDKSAAATQLLKAKAAMQQAQNTVDLARSQASIASQEQARAYDKAYQDRAFAQKSRQNDFSNQLAAQKYDLAVQKFDYQKQKYEQEKQKAYQAALASARKAVTDVRKYDKQGGYYDFDGDNVASQVERAAYAADQDEALYEKAVNRVGSANSVEQVQAQYKDFVSLLNEKINARVQEVTRSISSWDYNGFNEEYAAQLYLQAGLHASQLPQAIKQARAVSMLNTTLRSSLQEGEDKQADCVQELKRIGISEQEMASYLKVYQKSMESVRAEYDHALQFYLYLKDKYEGDTDIHVRNDIKNAFQAAVEVYAFTIAPYQTSGLSNREVLDKAAALQEHAETSEQQIIAKGIALYGQLTRTLKDVQADYDAATEQADRQKLYQEMVAFENARFQQEQDIDKTKTFEDLLPFLQNEAYAKPAVFFSLAEKIQTEEQADKCIQLLHEAEKGLPDNDDMRQYLEQVKTMVAAKKSEIPVLAYEELRNHADFAQMARAGRQRALEWGKEFDEIKKKDYTARPENYQRDGNATFIWDSKRSSDGKEYYSGVEYEQYLLVNGASSYLQKKYQENQALEYDEFIYQAIPNKVRDMFNYL